MTTGRINRVEKTEIVGGIAGATLKHTFIIVEQEVRSQPTRTNVDTVWDTILSRKTLFVAIISSNSRSSISD